VKRFKLEQKILERSTLLIVEDDKKMAAVMAQEANLMGYHTTTVDTVEDAKRASAQNLPDIVILDRMLADGGDGLDYVHWLNELEGDRPGILVTSRLTSVSDHVLGLEMGADDYLNKPFELVEFRARLKAVARRAISHRAPSSVLFFNTLELRRSTKQAFVNNELLDLRPQSFTLLNAIAERQGEWVSRKALWHEVWTDYRNLSPQDTVINTAICRLRNVLLSAEQAPSLVSEDLGYRLKPNDS